MIDCWTTELFSGNQLLMEELAVTADPPTVNCGTGSIVIKRYVGSYQEKEIWKFLLDMIEKIIVVMRYYNSKGQLCKSVVFYNCSLNLLSPIQVKLNVILNYERSELI